MPFFTSGAIEFFRELELNNDRSWFEANKKRYESSVKRPMEAFSVRLIELFREFEPEIAVEPKDCVFRIYRDVRFSKDKTPYKTHAGTVISKSGRRGSDPGIYFQFNPRGIGVASGYYDVDPENLLRFRRHIAANLEEFEARLEDPAFKTQFGGIEGRKNKIVPAEFREAAASQPYLFNKQFYYWAEGEAEDLLRDDLDQWVIEHFRAAIPMNEFLGRALK